MAPTFQLSHHGLERQPVMVIDDFVADPNALIDDASMLGFAPIGPYYPGVRAVVPPALVRRMLSTWEEAIAQVFDLAGPPSVIEAYYSLVTTPPSSLAPIQRLPHFDSVDPGRIAVLHYLSPKELGGTAFFRHRATGYESVSATRQSEYTQALEKDVKVHGLPAATYISGDTDIFEQVAHYDARFNRTIIYRGNTLHCADIPRGTPLPADPAIGRLTMNIFLQGALNK
jgi:Family of unknown function (DUF6445)